MNNTLGKTGFWIGVVEDRNDPLGVGRCKIRVFGFHSENLQELPTSDLPWALPANPPNASKTFSAPKNGDYVIGFFSDGPSGQAPIYTGVLPGILSQDPDTTKGFSPQGTQTNPSLPEGQIDQSVGQPTTVPLVRGVVANTAIAVADANRAHVCSFTAEMDFDMSGIKKTITDAIGSLRTLIEGLFSSEEQSPFSEAITQAKTAIQEKINWLNSQITDNQEYITALQNYAGQLQTLISELQSLPAEAQQMLAGCLTDAQSSLASVQQTIIKQSGATDIATAAAQTQQAIAQQQQIAQQTLNNIIPRPPR